MLCKCLQGCRSPEVVHIQEGYKTLETHEGSALNSVHSGKEGKECGQLLQWLPHWRYSVFPCNLSFRLWLGIPVCSVYDYEQRILRWTDYLPHQIAWAPGAQGTTPFMSHKDLLWKNFYTWRRQQNDSELWNRTNIRCSTHIQSLIVYRANIVPLDKKPSSHPHRASIPSFSDPWRSAVSALSWSPFGVYHLGMYSKTKVKCCQLLNGIAMCIFWGALLSCSMF